MIARISASGLTSAANCCATDKERKLSNGRETVSALGEAAGRLKRSERRKIMKGITVCMIVVLSLLGTGSASFSQVTITYTEGEVTVQRQGEGPWLKATVGTKLSSQDLIRAKAGSSAEVKIGSGNGVRLKENTTLRIDSLLEKKLNLSLLGGSVLARLDRLPEGAGFNLKTPEAVAGVRGTIFSCTCMGSTEVSVLEDVVNVVSIGEPEKSLNVGRFKKVSICPWDRARLVAKGTGILSKYILGKEKIAEFEKEALIKATGEAMILKDTVEQYPQGKEKALELAKTRAVSNLADIISSIKVDEERTIEALISQDEALLKELYSLLAKAHIVSTVFEKGVVLATVSVSRGKLEKVLKRKLPTIRLSVERITRSRYSSIFGAKARITTERAAKVDAYRRLAERIYGTVIDSKTTLEDYAVKNDTIRTSVKGLVRGARAKKTLHFSDGSVSSILEIDGDLITRDLSALTGDIFGRNYFSSPEVIEVKDFEDILTAQGMRF